MSKFLYGLKGYSRFFYWIFVFLITAVLLFLILPGEPKFRYEYQKGFPWRHENLIAPFDFAILKTPAEIEQEREQQLKEVVPYFVLDTAVYTTEINKLKTNWRISRDTTSELKLQAFDTLSSKLQQVYQTGILQRSFDTYEVLQDKSEIKKRIGTTVIKINAENVFSEKTAYNKVSSAIHNFMENHPQSRQWLSQISLENYITSNLSYDEATTQKEKEELTKNLSLTRGMIQLGERIILEGEIVDAEKYQILESLKDSFEKEKGKGINRYMVSIGKGILILVFMSLIFTFLYIYRRDILNKFSKLSFLLLLMVTFVLLTNFINIFPNLHIYLVPFAIFPIIIRTFFDSRTAIFTLIIATLLTGFYAPNNYEFVLMQIAAGVVAVFSLNKMHRRGHIIMAALLVFLTYSLVFATLELIYEGSLASFNYKILQWFAISSVLITLVYPLVYVFEKIFGFVSDVTLIELSDSNQPLLRKLAEEAPGTFQHSMQIANLSEEIIFKIGGNPFLVRAGALYHDIGKIASPGFFIENQAEGINPHDKMNYLKSAEKIIDHVKNGVRMAKKHKLPESLIEFIATHHGTSKAQYFYLKHLQENPEEMGDEKPFIYPGPLPKSKEAAVVMIVDGIEAASRSLKDKTYGNFRVLINNMIDQKIKDKQLDESDLTFHDIKLIKETLLNKLVNIYHLRIEYPKDNNLKNN